MRINYDSIYKLKSNVERYQRIGFHDAVIEIAVLREVLGILDAYEEEIARLNEIIDNSPKVEQGKWVGHNGTGQYDDWYCSLCGKYEEGTRNRDRLGSYCSYCGSRLSIDEGERVSNEY